MLNSLEVQAEMPAWERRSILNAVNTPKVTTPDPSSLGDGFTYDRETEYQGQYMEYTYTIRHDGNWLARFSVMQYPHCCGISILHDFTNNCDLNKYPSFNIALKNFFRKTVSSWKPNIQFIAVKQAIREEEYDEDDDEYYDKITGIEESYDYNPFILALFDVLQPTLISSFINRNSDNQCDVYQAVNPYRS
jgi:hypothetical protein